MTTRIDKIINMWEWAEAEAYAQYERGKRGRRVVETDEDGRTYIYYEMEETNEHTD